MVDAVHAYVAKAQVPQGYELLTWGDRSTEVRERLAMLGENGIQGLLIVILCLTLFLDMRLSIWVSLGIPFALLGTCFVLMLMGQTLNMISSFALIMGLGIVVDDAIVIGENVYTHRQMGKSARQAAIDGIHEVFPSVWASVLTTIIAFAPLLFVMGTMGKIMFVLPAVMISMLLISLFEASTILPAHLSHRDNLLFRICRNVFFIFYWIVPLLQWLAHYASAGMDRFIQYIYLPLLRRIMTHRMIFLSVCFSVMLISAGMFLGGVVQFVFFPKLDGTSIVCNVQFPNGTPEALTAHWADVIEESYWRTAQKILEETGEQVSVHSIRTIGSNMAGRGHGGGMSGGDSSHMASVEIQLVDAEKRSIQSFEIIDRWRKETGTIPGALVLTFDSAFAGPGGSAIEFKVTAPAEHAEELEKAVERCKSKLASYEGIYDIHDDDLPGKWEFRPKVKDFAVTLPTFCEMRTMEPKSCGFSAEGMKSNSWSATRNPPGGRSPVSMNSVSGSMAWNVPSENWRILRSSAGTPPSAGSTSSEAFRSPRTQTTRKCSRTGSSESFREPFRNSMRKESPFLHFCRN